MTRVRVTYEDGEEHVGVRAPGGEPVSAAPGALGGRPSTTFLPGRFLTTVRRLPVSLPA
jgi:hypothetical protein